MAALLSVHQKRVGAAIFKRSKLISIGWNSHKTHPKSRTWNNLQHAEFNALIGVDKSHLVGSEIFVVRLLKNGSWAYSKPCEACEELLKLAGVKRAWFVGQNGKIENMKLR